MHHGLLSLLIISGSLMIAVGATDYYDDYTGDMLKDEELVKRAWNSQFNGGMGKRGWNSQFSGGMGKRGWNSGFNGGMGKRGWNSGFSGEWEREPGIPTFLEVWVNGAGTVDLQVEWGRGRFGIQQWPDSQVKNKNVIEKILHEKKITNHDIAMFSLLIVYVRKMS